MGLAEQYDRLTDDITEALKVVSKLNDELRMVRVALAHGAMMAREAADKARIGVVPSPSQWCSVYLSHHGHAPSWCAFALNHEGKHSFELPE